jgi:hypothetical protein
MDASHNFPAVTTLAWHETPAARAFLARLVPGQFHVVRTRDVYTDRLELTGEPLEVLRILRDRHADKVFGATFYEAEDQGRAAEWFAALDGQPGIQQVLADHFGVSLSHCSQWDMTWATKQFRHWAAQNTAGRAAA